MSTTLTIAMGGIIEKKWLLGLYTTIKPSSVYFSYTIAQIKSTKTRKQHECWKMMRHEIFLLFVAQINTLWIVLFQIFPFTNKFQKTTSLIDNYTFNMQIEASRDIFFVCALENCFFKSI